eukprot:TRINITY_DN13950_c0_g1_i1.p1 TRINITY_DN13950_c0_g1~~TRINITY_DN13950_c0_g1_i1.p1  ORF type:complete len:983 (+),score=165.37 TRINITY_DN13950_c0_g1_i1:153-3101(+)
MEEEPGPSDAERPRKKRPSMAERRARKFEAERQKQAKSIANAFFRPVRSKKSSSAVIPPSFPISVGGYSIRFPFEQAYGPQLALMSSLLKALDRTLPPPASDADGRFLQDCATAAAGTSQPSHAVLEAPTGTGKTLALLTAALEWQRSVRSHGGAARIAELNQSKPDYAKFDIPNPILKKEAHESEASHDENSDGAIQIEEDDAIPIKKEEDMMVVDDDDDFQPTKVRTPSHRAPAAPDAISEKRNENNKRKIDEITQNETMKEAPIDKKRRKTIYVPKIYYATRTHAQVRKAISELRRSAYRPYMSVLGSRDHLCIHPQISKLSSAGTKEQECKKLITAEPTRCGMELKSEYLAESPELRPPKGSMQVWDVEDIVDLGKSMAACPFFAAKQMEKKAELIFCPYNYLIDPAIRESMGISIEDSIIIFDEAHNVEDCARDAATCQFGLHDLADASRQLQLAMSTEDIASLIKKPDLSAAKIAIEEEKEGDGGGGFAPGPTSKDLAKLVSWFHPVAEVMLNLYRWLREASETSLIQQEFEKMGNTWGSDAVLSLLQNVNVTCANIDYLKSCFKQGLAEYDLLFGPGEGKNPAGALFTGPCLKFIEAIIQVFDFILMEDMKFLGSYKLLIERTPRAASEFSAGFSTQGAHGGDDSAWNTSICFLCLHGAVGFRPLVKNARSIALVSGTLAPFDGLRAELGLENAGSNKVPHVSLTTSHVLATEAQLSVTRIKAFGNIPLRVDYKNQERADFQDAIGSILLSLIGAIPDGVLVFLPSYAMLDKLSRRWKSTGLWSKFQAVKPIFVEPRASTSSTAPAGDAPPPDLQQVWSTFDKAIKSNKGGIFFGVCRGKLSEGMDFQDEFARAVIIIGIPFAHVKSTSVILKKEYNTIKSKEDARFLTGGAWYTQQAFRALNQSIGRVVRHRYDYGSIILLDERFCDRDSEAQLSAWVRRALKPPLSVDEAVSHLRNFFPQASQTADAAKKSVK